MAAQTPFGVRQARQPRVHPWLRVLLVTAAVIFGALIVLPSAATWVYRDLSDRFGSAMASVGRPPTGEIQTSAATVSTATPVPFAGSGSTASGAPSVLIGKVCDLVSPAEVAHALGISAPLTPNYSFTPGTCSWRTNDTFRTIVALRYGPDAAEPAAVARGLGSRGLLLYGGRLTALQVGTPVPRTKPPRTLTQPATAWLDPQEWLRFRPRATTAQQSASLDALLAVLASKIPK